MDDVTISIANAFDLIVGILVRNNTSPINARHVAKALVSAEMSGQLGHGLSRVPSYAAQSASGKVDGHANPVVVDKKMRLFVLMQSMALLIQPWISRLMN